MISPDFTQATSTKTFMLDQPIALQLACIRSRSTINYGTKATINYGTKATINFGGQDIEEYFDVTNVEYYDAILGVPFLKKLGIVLEFGNPNHITIKGKEVPTNQEMVNEGHHRNDGGMRLSRSVNTVTTK